MIAHGRRSLADVAQLLGGERVDELFSDRLQVGECTGSERASTLLAQERPRPARTAGSGDPERTAEPERLAAVFATVDGAGDVESDPCSPG